MTMHGLANVKLLNSFCLFVMFSREVDCLISEPFMALKMYFIVALL